MDTLTEVLDMVTMVLERAGKYNLENEVIASAMIELKRNPNLTIEEALSCGLQEWDV